jgi:hypothetical protein
MKSHRISVPVCLGPIFCFLLLATCVAHGPLRAADAVAKSEAAAAAADAKEAGEIQDLGEGLFYLRVTNPAGQMGDVRAALAKHNALVVDLRGAKCSVAGAQALRSVLSPADAKTRVARFVLINGATSSAVPFTLGAGLPDDAVPGVLVIAPEAAGVSADVKTVGSTEDDRLACEAIAAGVAVTSLIDHQPEKKRYDEAVLVREHQGLPEPEAEQDAADEDATDEGAARPEKKDGQAKPLADSVLQVAVQTHRALVALRKL